ncbi:MAG: sigma-70 family RNA polymerase sigma factor [Tannerella sp.]|jgi:RNA polymerase sigma-70 factor (ECF subfamily)|nr:sigma-70 family RNA polymerase sigma factor [Tannerella sp.]
MNEKQLITGCLNGDRRSQKELYDLYSRKMMGVCLRYVSDRETARDLLQDGFVRVFTSMHSYSGVGAFEGWMRTVFVNGALEYLRKRDVLRDSADIESMHELLDEEESAVSRLSAKELMQLIDTLPEGFKAVFNLYAIEGYSHKEIADKLHITESTSRSQYVRARKWLQERIIRYELG